MTVKIQDAGTLRTITGLKVRVGGVTRTIRQIKVMDGGTLRTVATFSSALSVSISTVAEAIGSSSSLTTNSVTATPSGGTAPYTYAWTLVTNGGRNASTAGSPSLATTNFTKTGLVPTDVVTDVWRVTATDSFGQTATADVTATFSYSTGA